MRCDRCSFWTVGRLTQYASGDVVVNWEAPKGKGLCDKLSMETEADFGCTKFAETEDDHLVKGWKNGEPWQHWEVKNCPDCQGVGNGGGFGSSACHRCAGTGKVRHYDDGFVGEEQTRLHPKEREIIAPLTCRTCKHEIDIKWVACPLCGTRLEPVAEREDLGQGNAGGDFSQVIEARRKKREMLDTQIKQMNTRNENPQGEANG
jgi:hypothetical protein